ncbi:2-keto-4-pentenoate hydratase [Sphingomonas sp. VNH70]|uniref:2-keto-4-pentenoate hydratase n=1 Tax=Sphingomonas silueang TaxID=3156617 RepID=UPI0032B5ABB0
MSVTGEQAIAARFVAARRAGEGFDDYPGEPPASLADAYAIQAHAAALRGGAIGGWKIGRIADAAAATFGANRLAGPIFADTIVDNGGEDTPMAVIGDGFAAAEAEFLLRLGALPDPLPACWSIDDARAVVSDVAIGIEIASSPLRAINDLGPAVTVSDFGNNNGLLVGAAIPPDRAHKLDAIPVSLAIDGRTAGAGDTSTMLDGPYGAVRFLLELAGRQGLTVREGQWVSTGAVTGVHRVAPGARVVATFGELTLAATIVDQAVASGGAIDATA